MNASPRIEQLKAFLEDDPEDSFTRFALALEFLKSGDSGRALEQFNHIATHDPEYTGVYYHLGKLYAESGDNKQAAAVWSKGIEVAGRQKDHHSAREIRQIMSDLLEQDN